MNMRNRNFRLFGFIFALKNIREAFYETIV
jgi:hypothetical protein